MARASAARTAASLPPRSFRYHDRGSLATIRCTYAAGTFGHVELSGLPAWLAWASVHFAFRRDTWLLIPAVPAGLLAPPLDGVSVSDSAAPSQEAVHELSRRSA